MSMILFLDMDGVLNMPRAQAALPEERSHNPFGWIDHVAVGMVNRWGDLATALGGELRVVVSSAWRVGSSEIGAMQFLGVAGLMLHLHDDWATERLDGIRGDEIQLWIDAHPEFAERHMIVDDGADFHPHQEKRLIRTDAQDGMLLGHFHDGERLIRRTLA